MRNQDKLILTPLVLCLIVGFFLVIKGFSNISQEKATLTSLSQTGPQQAQRTAPRPQLPSQPQRVVSPSLHKTKAAKPVRPVAKARKPMRSPVFTLQKHSRTARSARPMVTKNILRSTPSQLSFARARQPASLPQATAAHREPHLPAELLSDLETIEYEQRQETDFLSKKVGLNAEQIRTLEMKRKDYLSQLAQYSQLEKQGRPQASADKRNLIYSHIEWMSQYLGPENYNEYLNLTSR